MSEQELRDRLHAEVDSITAPGNLSLLVEKGARRRRRTRVVVAGATLAVLAVVGGVVVALPRPAAAPVAAVPPSTDDGCVELPAPAAVRPSSVGLFGWPYRGDPALKGKIPALVQSAPHAETNRVTAVRPLLAIRMPVETSPNTFVYALAVQQPLGWFVRIGSAEQRGGQLLPIDEVALPMPEAGSVSAFVSLTGGFFAGSAGGALVALGAPGTQRIDYVGCRDGHTFATGSSGDTLVVATGPVEEAGRLTVRAGSRIVSSGRPQNVSKLPLAPPGSTDLSGYGDKLADTQLQLVAADRTRTVSLGPPPPANGSVYSSRVAVLGVCAGRGSVRFEATALPCDGRTHEVWRGVLDSYPRPFEVTGVPDPSTGRTSLSVVLTVVAT